MKRFFPFIALALIVMSGCKTSKNALDNSQNEIWQTIIVKQLDASIDNDIITARYDNGTTLYYRILDNFGNVALTWDRTGGRKSADEGYSAYKGDIDIPSFVVSGSNDEFMFRVVEIDDDAFKGCTNVTSINIPYSINRILNNALSGCSSLTRITVNQNNPVYKDVDGILFSKDNKMLIKYPAKRNIVEYIISEEVSFICPEAFQDCSYLRKLTVGNFVTAISDYAFKNCSALEEVTLGGNVRIIGVESFFGCTKLATINSRGIFPPHNCPTVFEDTTKQNCKVYVPKGQLFNYKRRLEWSDFKNMVEF